MGNYGTCSIMHERKKDEIKNKNIPQNLTKEISILRGLDNIGGTCYMNVILQILSNTIKLTDYFLNEFQMNENDGSKKLSNAFYTLLKHLWNKNAKTKSFSPDNFKKVLNEINPLFSSIADNNSKDLLDFLLLILHNELNRKIDECENKD